MGGVCLRDRPTPTHRSNRTLRSRSDASRQVPGRGPPEVIKERSNVKLRSHGSIATAAVTAAVVAGTLCFMFVPLSANSRQRRRRGKAKGKGGGKGGEAISPPRVPRRGRPTAKSDFSGFWQRPYSPDMSQRDRYEREAVSAGRSGQARRGARHRIRMQRTRPRWDEAEQARLLPFTACGLEELADLRPRLMATTPALACPSA